MDVRSLEPLIGGRGGLIESIDFRGGDDFCGSRFAAGRLVAAPWGARTFAHSPAIERLDLGGAQCAAVNPDVIDLSLQQVVLLGTTTDHPNRVDVDCGAVVSAVAAASAPLR